MPLKARIFKNASKSMPKQSDIYFVIKLLLLVSLLFSGVAITSDG
jgi:hypothetical protein